jgi:hypothetical protein
METTGHEAEAQVPGENVVAPNLSFGGRGVERLELSGRKAELSSRDR